MSMTGEATIRVFAPGVVLTEDDPYTRPKIGRESAAGERVREVRDLNHEVRDRTRELPDLIREVRNLTRELGDLVLEVRDHIRELRDLALEVPDRFGEP
jgi:hypothetical protein